jgi:hypothetical protein
MDYEFSLFKKPIASLIKDLKKALLNNRYEHDGAAIVVGDHVNIRIGGVFHSWVMRSEAVQRAIEAGDKLAEAAAREAAFLVDDLKCVRLMESADHNEVPTLGMNFVLNLLFHAGTSKVGTWYHGPFTTNWTNFTTADSSWGKVSGGLATELANASYVETNRQAAVFGDVAANKTITASTATRFTFETGVTNISIYGSTLNNTNTVAYSGTDKVLLSAAPFDAPKQGLGAGDKLDIEYEMEGVST